TADAFGAACTSANVPLNNNEGLFKLNDRANQENVEFLDRFPYLNTPLGGTRAN
ncbi:MAG: hypothetical protein RLZZ182_2215, partial [Pseudomonadota bacterium]